LNITNRKVDFVAVDYLLQNSQLFAMVSSGILWNAARDHWIFLWKTLVPNHNSTHNTSSHTFVQSSNKSIKNRFI